MNFRNIVIFLAVFGCASTSYTAEYWGTFAVEHWGTIERIETDTFVSYSQRGVDSEGERLVRSATLFTKGLDAKTIYTICWPSPRSQRSFYFSLERLWQQQERRNHNKQRNL